MEPSIEDIARQAIEDFNQVGDGRFEIDAEARARWVEEPVLVPMRAALDGTEYRGADALERWAGDIAEDWQSLQADVQRVRVLGDTSALIYVELRAVGRGSGIETRAQLFFHMTVRDGLVASMRTFHSEADALKAAAT